MVKQEASSVCPGSEDSSASYAYLSKEAVLKILKLITQKFIASLFYLNRSYLSQLFRQKTGITPEQYRNNTVKNTVKKQENHDIKNGSPYFFPLYQREEAQAAVFYQHL